MMFTLDISATHTILKESKTTNKVTIEWHGLTATADIVSGDWEGDPSVPNGVHHLPPYAQDIDVLDPDGESILDYISDKGMEEVETALLEAFGDGDDDRGAEDE